MTSSHGDRKSHRIVLDIWALFQTLWLRDQLYEIVEATEHPQSSLHNVTAAFISPSLHYTFYAILSYQQVHRLS